MSLVDECRKCDAFCCRHIAVPIDKPVNKTDIDHVRWYLLHENVWVSISNSGQWLLEFRTPCRNIGRDYKCKDYENRPQICKEYPSDDELCERQTDEKSYKHLFTNDKEFMAYIDSRKKRVKKPVPKKR